jgi:transcription elongation GreA/GreB family factor
MERLNRFVRGASHSLYRDQQQVNLLDNLLQKAEVRPSRSTPKSVVRMSSRVQVHDIRAQKEDVYTVVFPDEANASLGLIFCSCSDRGSRF